MMAEPGFMWRQNIARQPKRRSQHQSQEVIQGLIVSLMQWLRTTHSRVVDQEIDVPPTADR